MGSAAGQFPKTMEVTKADRSLRIAVVYGRTPLPMRRADQMTVAHLLGFLYARGHKTDLYYIDTGGVASEQDRAWLSEICHRVFAYRRNAASVLGGFVRGLFRLTPVQVGFFSHAGQRQDLRRNLADYDIVYTYYFRSAEVTRDLGRRYRDPASDPNLPATFLAFQLSQTLNTQRIARNAPNLALRLFYSLETRLVERYEARIWRHFTRSILIGRSDVAAIAAACAKFDLPTISNNIIGAHGTDVRRFSPHDDIAVTPYSLVFSGVVKTPTNVQAVQWFTENVWPIVRARCPQATFKIVGREPTAEVLRLARVPGVTVTGTVPDPAVEIAGAAICVNSMRAGGGMQNKLIEYLASEKPVVATSVANEGIGGVPGEHLLIADDPQSFADAILRLFDSPEEAARLARAGREFVLKNWTWEHHFLKLEDDFREAIGAPADGVAKHLELD